MLLYSSTINQYLKKLRPIVRDILSREMGLSVRTNRFEYQGRLYPIHVVMFEDDKKWGHFIADLYQLGLNKNLITLMNEQFTKNILRHELAHYFCFIKYGSAVNPHGEEFRTICREFGWGEDVYLSQTKEQAENQKLSADHQKILEKVSKLLNLGSSQNTHEAALATAKANELLLKYNLESSLYNESEEEVCCLKVIEQKKMDTKLGALYDIIKHFYVQPVFNKGKNVVYLEIVGNRVNVELAQYILHFLSSEFDYFWKKTKKENPHLKGVAAKNSYFRGLAKGYEQKVLLSKNSIATKTDLIKINQNLQRQLAMSHPRLSSVKTTVSKNCKESESIGKTHGKNLNIRSALNNKKKPVFLLT